MNQKETLNNHWQSYAELLKNWVVFSQKHLYTCPDRPELICYGAGEHGHWGVHTHQKAFSAFAIAATLDEIDWSDTPLTREKVLEQALAMLRYNLSTHTSMDYVCTDGEKWGYNFTFPLLNWLYALGIERMFHAIEAIDQYLTDNDRAMLKKIMLYECDCMLNDFEIKAALFDGKGNMPESNIWNGSILYRAAMLYSDAPNREAYIEKARRFFANGISIPSDEFSDEIVDGMRIKDLFIGANMFESYACNHHGYLNIGYMVICLSNIAMLHFFMKSKNIKTDQIVYRHMKELWKLIRSCTFSDGRLLRIGGDSRARYCYCQDYALPMWALIEDFFDEDCSDLEIGWLKILQKETAINGDGSFLSNRFGYFEELSPVYYTRLETDRANTISMYLYWHKKYNLSGSKSSDKFENWADEYHGSALSATGNRYASFTWRSSEKPQGLLVPKDDSSLAEWRYNLAGRIIGVGKENYDELEGCSVDSFNGGFVTCGSTISYSDVFLAEGQLKETMAKKYVAFAALPDESTVLCLQYANARNRIFVSSIRGVYWNIPNDIFNGRSRTLFSDNGVIHLSGGDYANRCETISLGEYANIDNKIGISSTMPLTLVRSGIRQVEIKHKDKHSGTLYAEEICAPYVAHPQWYDRGDNLIDVGFAMSLGDASETGALKESLFTPEVPGLKAIGVKAKDGHKYVLVANFSDDECEFDPTILCLGHAINVANGNREIKRQIKVQEAILLKF